MILKNAFSLRKTDSIKKKNLTIFINCFTKGLEWLKQSMTI